MYNTPGVTGGIGTGVVGAGALAQTGFSSLAIVAAAITLVVGGFVLLRASRMRREAARVQG
ncbi:MULTISPECIES: LPXTG cell wall anchor domain-containing protein [Cellulosimicrobium]|uniref:LPXTG cell wall anchor domain-containing protein n=1 Tax=Cellulosimicrobium cellulans TaxID=1710 RepID=UPI001EDAA54A|nr:LPXTG cell wall anchor domain-containing protein [Cellulosimicrobium cellulans]UKJ62275.1 LPXTG cell wall anchor domain-containing protein [Cellulosimicrobium cellulans]